MSGIYKIPFFGLDRQYLSIKEEILEATDQVLTSGQVLDGSFTKKFEQSIAKMCERKYAVAVGSGTSALEFALRTIDYTDLNNPKNKIVIPTQSFVATLNSVLEAGYEPSFCDVDRLTGLIKPGTITEYSEQIAGIVAVNLFGNVADFDRLNTYKQIYTDSPITVIEDAAQSFGAYYKGVPSGKLGDISCLSFDPTKNLPAYGSGGMVLTDDKWIEEIIRNYRNNGKPSDHNMSGTNSKMSEIECAQMLVKLKYFDQWQQRRQAIAEYYIDHLSDVVKIPPIEDTVTPCWHKFVMHVSNRHKLIVGLGEQGIETKVHYGTPLHFYPIAARIGLNHQIFEGAEDFAKTCVSLPIYPEMSDSEVEAVATAVRNHV